MAYSPLDEGRLLKHGPLVAISEREGVRPATLAIAWLLARSGVAAIPKAGNASHVHDNRMAAELSLDPRLMAEIDRAFPPPREASPLQVI